MKPTYIVAGNHAEFERYVNAKNEYWTKQAMLMPEYRFVYDVNSLRGMDSIKGFYIGTWDKRHDIKQIQEQIAIIKAKTRSQYLVHLNGVLMHHDDYTLEEVQRGVVRIKLVQGMVGQLSITSITGNRHELNVDCTLGSNTWMVQL